jgi:hypothetical protein
VREEQGDGKQNSENRIVHPRAEEQNTVEILNSVFCSLEFSC